MQYRTMPGDNRPLSVLGFGVMRLPVRAGRIDRRRADDMLLTAIRNGVNYLDTGFHYQTGQSEPYIGSFLDRYKLHGTVAVATKLPHWITRTRADMEKLLDQQLRRLRTQRIEYYLVHNLVGGSWASLLERDVIGFLDGARAAGKIGRIGFSWHGTPEDFAGVVDACPWDFCQIQYNILDERRQAGTAGLEYAASRGLGVVVMEPLRGGKLATKIPETAMAFWRERPEKSPAAWALSWVWNRPEVTVVLSGFSRADHMRETLELAGSVYPGMLDPDQMNMVGRVRDAYRDAELIACTSCRYCMPCPFGVSIPEVFDWYNEWKTVRHTLAQRMFYLATVGGALSGRSGLASRCRSCGVCLEKCPQSLPIPDLMTAIAREYEGGLGRAIETLVKCLKPCRKSQTKPPVKKQ